MARSILGSATVLCLLLSSSTADASRRVSRGEGGGQINSRKARRSSRSSGLRASTPSSIIVPIEHSIEFKTTNDIINFVYPDTTLKGCRTNNGNEHIQSWLEENGNNGYLFNDLTSCCEGRFPNDVEACLDVSNNLLDGSSFSVDKPNQFVEQQFVPTLDIMQPGENKSITQEQRRLAKSNKGGKYYYTTTWHKPPSQAWHGGHWLTKSGKVGKSVKSSKKSSHYTSSWWGGIPYEPRVTPLPTPRPTPKPTWMDNIPGGKSVEITMGGLLKATNLIVPQTGTDEMLNLAIAFEQTLLRALSDSYICDVYSIGGVQVGSDGSYSSRVRSGVFNRQRHLQEVVEEADVLFNCQVTRPCPDCTQTDAVIMGSQVFEETFDILNDKANDGELTTIFCILAEVAQVVPVPCSVEITSVEGTSLKMEFVMIDAPPTTPRPTPMPQPVMEWPPTPSPTSMEEPVPPPTSKPDSVMTDAPVTAVPVPTTDAPVSAVPVPTTMEPVPTTMEPLPTTMEPVPISSSPTISPVAPTIPPIAPVTPSPVSSLPTTSPNVALTTLSPTGGSSTAVTSSPTQGSTSVATSPSTPGATSLSLSPTPVPEPVGTAGPTNIPPGAEYYTGFERGLPFPDGYPEWSTEGDGMWDLTTESVHSITYSIKSPDLSNAELAPASSNVTLTTNPAWPAGTLVFSLFAGVNMPFDDVVYFVDGGQRGQASNMVDFETRTIFLPPGPHTVTFSFRYNPLDLDAFPPSGPERIGAAFIDDVYFLPEGVTMSPTITPGSSVVSVSPTQSSSSVSSSSSSGSSTTGSPTTEGPPSSSPPTSSSPIGVGTAGPTTIPPGAEYYTGFERGAPFPDGYPEWTTTGDGAWDLTTERVHSGTYSIKSPDFMINPDDITPKTSNVTLVTNPAWPSGTLVFSLLAGTDMPFDDLLYYLDGMQRGQAGNMVDFETRVIQLPPGQHEITFSYRYNPVGVDAMPPIPVDRIGAVFIDDVYFLPEGVTMSPTITPGTAPAPLLSLSPVSSAGSDGSSPTRAPSYYPSYVPTGASAAGTTVSPAGNATTVSPAGQEPTRAPSYYPSYVPTGADGAASIPDGSSAPTPSNGTSSGGPTIIPAGSVYYDGFEQATFPNDQEWSTNGNGVWELTTERAAGGIYSIKSPDLSNEAYTPSSSNVTLSFLDPDFEGGTLVLSVMPGIVEPFDNLEYFVNGIQRGVLSAPQQDGEFELLELSLQEGPQEITFQYNYNPYSLDALPPSPPDMIGAVYIDDIYIEPIEAGKVPADGIPVASDFFDGFESGDFSGGEAGLNWSFSGEEVWVVDTTKPHLGDFSAHVKTADISSSGNYAQLDLLVDSPNAGFIQFYVNAPVAMPFESFDLWVDDQFLTGLSTEDGPWAQAGAVLSSGEHTVSWRLSRNPGGAPDDILEGLEQPPFRTGEAWLDTVQLLPATPSFTEIWESGDFTANPWILSGDGDWSITDSVQFEGANSATIASTDIEATTGIADLSIDIITEGGGTLEFQVLPSVAGPFDIANVLIDDIVVLTYTTVSEDWLAQEISIQPGKRRVTFQLLKNPGNVPDDLISGIPSPPGREGQLWLDGIVFTAAA